MIFNLSMPCAVLLGLAITSCSSVESAKETTSCGNAIEPEQVTILDLRALASQPDRVPEYVTEQIGAYELITSQPIGILVGGSRCSYYDCIEEGKAIDGIEGINNARYEAALRGCDLLLALELKVIPPKGGGYSISSSSGRPKGNWAWIVHMGKSG